MTDRILVADIGGTHVRFGLADAQEGIRRASTLYCADFSEPAAAAEEYLIGLDRSQRPQRAVFAIASPVTGDRVEMTFRRLYTTFGIHNYFWKARPIRVER